MIDLLNKILIHFNYKITEVVPRLRKDISPIDLQYEIKRRNLTQRYFAKRFNVTDGAISGAINNDPLLKNLRFKIIQDLNSLQNPSLKSTNNKEVVQ